MATTSPEALAELLRGAASRDLWLPVEGTSMGRTIVAGGRVRVSRIDRSPRPGEIWAFVDATGTTLVHRYLRRLPDGRCQFRGDGRPRPDPPVPPRLLVGRVVEVRYDDRRGPPWRTSRARWSAAVLRRKLTRRVTRHRRISGSA